jgi:hypothetical protein
MWKRAAATLAVGLFIGGLVWWSMVQGYTSELGTDNVVEILIEDSSTEGFDDVLATTSFLGDAAEPLLWSSVELALVVNGCTG